MKKWPLVLGVALVLVGLLGCCSAAVVASIAASDSDGGRGPMMRDRGQDGSRDRGGRGPGMGRRGFDDEDFESTGQRIFLTGTTDERRIPRESVFVHRHLDQGGCAGCHGEDGRGGDRIYGRGGSKRAPDIRYETLTSPHEEGEEREPAWTQAQVERAIRDGVEPDGKKLSTLMPRWDMNDTEMRDIVGYLKELD